MNCEMCGKESELLRAIVEGTELKVCQTCSSYGKIIGKVRTSSHVPEIKRQLQPKIEDETIIIPDFGRLIKQGREKLGLNQKDFAAKLFVKESIIHKIETEAIEPDVQLASKLEKALGLKLLQQAGDEKPSSYKPKNEDLTIGDLVKVRRR